MTHCRVDRPASSQKAARRCTVRVYLLASAMSLLAQACLEDGAQSSNMQSCDGSSCATEPRSSDADGGEDDARDESDSGAADCDSEVRCMDGSCPSAANVTCRVSACARDARFCDCDADRDGELAWFCGGTDVDADGDGVAAEEYGGRDCDDTDRSRFTGNTEVCDYAGHDEDCNWDTVAGDPSVDMLADKDRDESIDVHCINIDTQTNQVYPADRSAMDCDDAVDETHPGAGEDCDDADNDCDGYIDELPSPNEGEHEAFGAQNFYCRDADGDGSSTHDDRVRRCGPPIGYIPCRPEQPADCDDGDERVHPGAQEVCDGLDNDCDGLWEGHGAPATALFNRPILNDSTLDCVDGAWKIVDCPADRLWCDTTTIAGGCEVDATRLRNCRRCGTSCAFACGARGCEEVSKIDVGVDFACGITSEGHAVCWGRGAEGRLGNDDTRSSSVAQAVIGVDDASDIAVGEGHACIVTGPSRAVYCWGDNRTGQLANPDAADFSTAPVPVPGTETIQLTAAQQIAAGAAHSCALMSDGSVACWGSTEEGRLGNLVVTSDVGFPQLILREGNDPEFGKIGLVVRDAVLLAVGNEHSCILNRAGTVECWGSNAYGQLGSSSETPSSASPVVVPGLSNVTEIAAGDRHTCAVSSGQVYCWGANEKLQLGRPAGDADYAPGLVSGLRDVVSIAAGTAFACATTADGSLYCWGNNASGELITEQPNTSAEPVLMPVQDPAQVSLGGGFACVLTQAAETRCWGTNLYGQLGRGFASLELERLVERISPLKGSRL